MKVLFVTDFYYTVSSGAKTSARAHFKTLQKLYGERNITMVALVGRELPSDTDKSHIIVSGSHNNAVLLWNCLRGYSTYLNRAGIKRIINIIQENRTDVVFIDNSIFGKLIQEIKKVHPNIVVLSYYHDVKAKLARDWLKVAPLYKKPVLLAMLSNERLTAQYANVNFVLGNREEKLFIEAYGKRPEAQLSVYMDVQPSDDFHRKSYNQRKKILFFGGYYLPNIHGINWFIEEVYPKLEYETELIVAGHDMDKLKEKYYQEGVTIKGYIKNIEELYRDADIVISPIFEGGGMKVKVAEAMAFGKIVIGSNESFEGYQEKIPAEYWDRFFYRANTAEEFAAQVHRALCLSEDKHHFNPEIRVLYESGFSENYAEKVISKMINKCVGENR